MCIMIYVFILSMSNLNTVTQLSSIHVFRCVDRDQLRLEELELLLLFVNFHRISIIHSTEVQHQIDCNLRS